MPHGLSHFIIQCLNTAIEGHNGGVRVSCFLLGLVCTTGSLDETKRR